MGKNMDQKELIVEEQKIVDQLIFDIEQDIKNADVQLKKIISDFKKAKELGPDAYGMLVDAQRKKGDTIIRRYEAKMFKDELYSSRLILKCEDEDGDTEEIELKVGLHSYYHGTDKIVWDWTTPVCFHYVTENSDEDYVTTVKDKRGKEIKTKYELCMKRNIEMRFSHVKKVIHLFPLVSENAEQIIFDEFLNELVSRRGNKEFRNIVFSIQKKQAEIIKTPYKENLIVQGCAGSGKSMIMLHRLPLLIKNYSETFDKSNIYIISPSETYIQMVESMRKELEITELEMGTINQYYDHILSKYGVDLDSYGRVSYATRITNEQLQYVYSDLLIKDIQAHMESLINRNDFDYSEGIHTLGLKERKVNSKNYGAQISDYILMGNSIISANNAVLQDEFSLIRTYVMVINDLVIKVKDKKMHILRNIAKKIDEQKKLIREKRYKLSKSSGLGENEREKEETAINQAINIIGYYKEERKKCEADNEYFAGLNDYCRIFDKLQFLNGGLKGIYEDNSTEEVYSLIGTKQLIYKLLMEFFENVLKIEEKYLEFTDSIADYIFKQKKRLPELLMINNDYLEQEYYEKLISITEYYTNLQINIVRKVYLKIMEKCGVVPDKKGEIKALSFSPYVYTQIMYLLKGVPNAARERLICIDEAQGLAPLELKLMKDINGSQVIFNLFGDVKQHIEGTKGIDSWAELKDLVEVEPKLLMENYRNASQITTECNKRFDMHMRAINTPGNGVSVISNSKELDEQMNHIFMRVQRPGLCAIIVDDIYEAKQLLFQYAVYQSKIHDMTGENFDFHRTRWNLITVEQSKGLEFGTVIAISGRMTTNKKYIAYTRALDELYIYDDVLIIDQNVINEIVDNEKQSKKKVKEDIRAREKKKKKGDIVDYSQSEVKKYFESKGLEVNDMRAKGGYLWVIGEQAEIKQYVDEACEKFGISGSYSSGKATGFRPGCYFKTKK